MFDWNSLEVERHKSRVHSVLIPQELLQLAMERTGCQDLQGECFHKVRAWLLDQIEQNLALPVIRHASVFFKPLEDDGARLIFLSR